MFDLDIDAIARLNDAEGRHSQRMRDEHDRKRVGPDIDQGQAHSINGD